MTAIVNDSALVERLRAERAEAGADRWDEVWDGVYMIMPLPNDEHQEIVTALASVFQNVVGWSGVGRVRAGVNVSDDDGDWTHNYRCPDVAVFLRDTTAVNRSTYWYGGPDFGVEVVSKDDQTREKLRFYAEVGVRELLIVDRFPWALDLYREHEGGLANVGRSILSHSDVLTSLVLPVTFQLVAGEERPRIEVIASETQRWLV
jgi:Uma2 family endonuclease